MSDENQDHQPPRIPHPDFDGHLERPLESMTPEDRLAWAWEGALLLDLARRSRVQASQLGRERMRDEKQP
jgi:hypothetical protein